MLLPSRKRPRRSGSDNVPTGLLHAARGRPMKHSSELKVDRKARLEQSKLFHSQQQITRRKPELSRLEQLPVELLELIFFFCLEINLPRASFKLGEKLARYETFEALTLYAFFDFGVQPDFHTPIHRSMVRQLDVRERILLQNDILCCKWCTLDFLRSCAPALMSLQASQWLQVARSFIEDGLDVNNSLSVLEQNGNGVPLKSYPAQDMPKTDVLGPKPMSNASRIQALASLPPATDEEAIRRHFKLDDEASKLPCIITHHFGTFIWEQGRFHPERLGRSIFAVRTIPQHVLRGNPWTDGKVELLKILRQGIRYLQGRPEIAISKDAMFQGMRNAIIEGNKAALLVLLELYLTCVKYEKTTNGPYRAGPAEEPDCDPMVNLPADLFQLAYTHAAAHSTTKGDQFELLRLLFRGGIENIHPNDEMLTQWATHAKSRQNSGGIPEDVRAATWLLQHMEHTMASMSCYGVEDSSLDGRASDLADAIGYRYDYAPERPHGSYTVFELLDVSP
jgi:hypothetical protein